MANPLYELDTFVNKFKNLWHAGNDARLCLETKAGKATVSLHLDLGDLPQQHDQPHGRPYQRRTSPSQQRRRERRAAARLAGTEENAAEEATVNDIIGETAVEALEKNIVPVKAAEKVENLTEEVEDEFVRDESFLNNIVNEEDSNRFLVFYTDISKESEAQDAINFVQEKLKYNFKRYKLKQEDQVYKIGEILKQDNTFKIPVKLIKMSPLKLENS